MQKRGGLTLYEAAQNIFVFIFDFFDIHYLRPWRISFVFEDAIG